MKEKAKTVSKTLSLRVPKDLHEQAKRLAKLKGISVSDWIRSLLRAEALNA